MISVDIIVKGKIYKSDDPSAQKKILKEYDGMTIEEKNRIEKVCEELKIKINNKYLDSAKAMNSKQIDELLGEIRSKLDDLNTEQFHFGIPNYEALHYFQRIIKAYVLNDLREISFAKWKEEKEKRERGEFDFDSMDI